MTALLSVTLLICLPAAKGKARQAALSDRVGETGVSAKEVPHDGRASVEARALSRSESAHPHSLRFLARHTNAVLAHKCLPPHRDGPRTWLQARTWHRLAHRAKRGTCGPVVDGCLSALISRESGWDVHATNAVTGAYGLPQALPGSKMSSAGSDWRDSASTQIRWMIGYVSKYGGSCGALAFQEAHGWY